MGTWKKSAETIRRQELEESNSMGCVHTERSFRNMVNERNLNLKCLISITLRITQYDKNKRRVLEIWFSVKHGQLVEKFKHFAKSNFEQNAPLRIPTEL